MRTVATAGMLRRELSARNLERAAAFDHELSAGNIPSIVYAPRFADPGPMYSGEVEHEPHPAGHGNFLDASWRRILADPAWRARLIKTYTGSARLPRAADRRRGELECATSSDALLMNIFCYPGWLRRPAVCSWLGVEPGVLPEFGVRAGLAMQRGEVDRTELDLLLRDPDDDLLGDLLIEAKLTETSFGTASWSRVRRYLQLDEVFDPTLLPQTSAGQVAGYQLVRGALAAHATGGRFLLLCDCRRADLAEMWFQVIRAVRSADLRGRLRLGSWQELAALSPPALRRFLAAKYGIVPHAAT